MSRQSEQIDKLVDALSKAQGEISNPVFDRRNPHFNSSYASEAAIMDAIRVPLSKHGLALTHQTVDGVLITKLLHGNQWLGTEWKLNVTSGKPQERGSELTYGRRYNICGLIGIVGDSDDDANAATKAPVKVIERPKPVPPSKAAAALVEIASNVTAVASDDKYPAGDTITADKPFDWKVFGGQILEQAKQANIATPEQTAKLEEMKTTKPKSYKNLMAALDKITAEREEKQPKPEDDPDAYRVWLIDQMSRYDTAAELNGFMTRQQPLWEPCFPPDIEDWTDLFKERAGELGK
jgi:hypothetical protein